MMSAWCLALLVAVVSGTEEATYPCTRPYPECPYPECRSFRKNGVPPVTSGPTCRIACETAEGLHAGIWGRLEDFKGRPGAGQCQCFVRHGNNRVICEDSDYSSRPWWERQALIVHGNSVVGAAVAYAMDLVYTVGDTGGAATAVVGAVEAGVRHVLVHRWRHGSAENVGIWLNQPVHRELAEGKVDKCGLGSVTDLQNSNEFVIPKDPAKKGASKGKQGCNSDVSCWFKSSSGFESDTLEIQLVAGDGTQVGIAKLRDLEEGNRGTLTWDASPRNVTTPSWW
eukprot:Skav211097  [mRNA]  locus=scaffold2002:408667:412302:- [translate_table: standard]